MILEGSGVACQVWQGLKHNTSRDTVLVKYPRPIQSRTIWDTRLLQHCRMPVADTKHRGVAWARNIWKENVTQLICQPALAN